MPNEQSSRSLPTYYKVLAPDRRPFHGGRGQWPEPGEWLTVGGPLVPCKNGLHVCTHENLVQWLGPEIWVCEVDESDGIVHTDDKSVVRRARLSERLNRWTNRTARLFACDCAERVVHLAPDARSYNAIRIARLYAEGAAHGADLAAERVTARDAGAGASGPAGWAAAWSATCNAAWDAAGAAARDAGLNEDVTWSEPWSEVEAAAYYAERTWQTERLFWYLDGEA